MHVPYLALQRFQLLLLHPAQLYCEVAQVALQVPMHAPIDAKHADVCQRHAESEGLRERGSILLQLLPRNVGYRQVRGPVPVQPGDPRHELWADQRGKRLLNDILPRHHGGHLCPWDDHGEYHPISPHPPSAFKEAKEKEEHTAGEHGASTNGNQVKQKDCNGDDAAAAQLAKVDPAVRGRRPVRGIAEEAECQMADHRPSGFQSHEGAHLPVRDPAILEPQGGIHHCVDRDLIEAAKNGNAPKASDLAKLTEVLNDSLKDNGRL
mmetsp:Transcript_61704/g.171030  ORF Transcript_61704/g.171030 Transcript_61704/m.171030 type:complete len:265 (-) Transcript_61704:359-1153(-)